MWHPQRQVTSLSALGEATTGPLREGRGWQSSKQGQERGEESRAPCTKAPDVGPQVGTSCHLMLPIHSTASRPPNETQGIDEKEAPRFSLVTQGRGGISHRELHPVEQERSIQKLNTESPRRSISFLNAIKTAPQLRGRS